MNKEALNLKAFNMYGGFNQEGNEYHILNTKTPVPWCNVMANEHFGTIVSSYGTVYSYYKNSQGFKISNWCNDWVSFKPGESFEGIYDKEYNLVYGFGYTKVLQEDDGIEKETKSGRFLVNIRKYQFLYQAMKMLRFKESS